MLIKNLLTVVLVACLAAEASAGYWNCFFPSKNNNNNKKGKKVVEVRQPVDVAPKWTQKVVVEPRRPAGEADFDALNRYLVERLGYEEDTQANLAYIKQNIGQLEGGLKRAGQMVLELANNGEKCDNNLMLILNEVIRADLEPTGKKRIEKVMQASRSKATQVCSRHIERSFEEADLSLAKFLSVFRPMDVFESIFRSRKELKSSGMSEVLRVLSKEDPEAQFRYYKYDELTGEPVEFIRDADRFRYALDKYLVEPCLRLVSKGQLLDNVRALTLSMSINFKHNTKRPVLFYIDEMDKISSLVKRDAYLTSLTDELHSLAWRKEACVSLLKMDFSAQVSLLQFDMLILPQE